VPHQLTIDFTYDDAVTLMATNAPRVLLANVTLREMEHTVQEIGELRRRVMQEGARALPEVRQRIAELRFRQRMFADILEYIESGDDAAEEPPK